MDLITKPHLRVIRIGGGANRVVRTSQIKVECWQTQYTGTDISDYLKAAAENSPLLFLYNKLQFLFIPIQVYVFVHLILSIWSSFPVKGKPIIINPLPSLFPLPPPPAALFTLH